MMTPQEPVAREVESPAAPDADDSTDVAKLRRECARYRTALRDAEKVIGEKDERLARIDRATVEGLAADRLLHPADLWFVVDDLEALRGEDGEIDPERVTGKVDEVVTERPHWAKPPAPSPDFDGGARPPVQQDPTLGQMFKNSVGGGR